jgi:hypothetical protein
MNDLFKFSDFLTDFSAAAHERGFVSRVLADTPDGPVEAWEREGEGAIGYLSAGIHGDEPAGPLAVLELMSQGAFSEDLHWLICPALNPGGLVLGSRESREHIDLNRDYLQLQSLEIAAHAKWLARIPIPDFFVSLHEDWESEGFYFYEINLGEDCPERADALLGAVSESFPPEPGPEIDGHEARRPGWIYHSADADLPESWPEAIYLAKNGCPLSFTFETPSKARLQDRVAAHVAGFQALTDWICMRK